MPSEDHIQRNACPTGPAENKILVAAPVASTSTPLDLTSIIAVPGQGNIYVTIFCDGLLYYKFATTNANIVDETATSGNTRCFAQPSSVPFRVVVPMGARYLVVKTAGTYVRVHESAEVRS
jgi:hypothetical protein